MHSFSGLYFPGDSWDLDIEDTILKNALLLFDKIHAIIPEVFSVDLKSVQPFEELPPSLAKARHSRENELAGIKEAIDSGKWPPERKELYLPEIDRYNRIANFLDKVKLLRQEDVLELVDPQEDLLGSPKGQESDILYGSALADLRDEEFRAAAANFCNERAVLYKDEAEQEWLAQLGSSSGFPADEWQWLPASGSFCGELVGTVSMSMWAAFVVNQTLLSAHKHSLIPITPSEAFHGLLTSKIKHVQNLSANESLCPLLKITLPVPQAMTFEGIMESRLALKDELSALRKQLALLMERIRVESWGANLEREIRHIISHDVEPAAEELRRSFTSSTDSEIWRGAASYAPSAFHMLVNIWPGLPPLRVMALSVGNMSKEIGLEDLNKNLLSNGISILLQHS